MRRLYADISSSISSCSWLHVRPVANIPQFTTRSMSAPTEQKVLKVFSHAFCSSWAWLSELGAVVWEGTR